ncbi:epididymal-specific lipocalin-12 isoform X3 [Sciurus carolinensis]|uniref:epididymal-specific lipocalin-12 isoform X3 n=1 Tax=Sciurus carolinensis TaxID=30640 RepID=UPI001FB24739|nr:epididymal-specific lipocalin-12 isoform X3 [Sciurus carolinensis]
MSVQSSLLDPFWAGPWQRESPCCAGPFGSPGCLPSLSRGPTHALLAAGQLAVPPTPCWQRSLWGPGGWPSSVGPCCLPRTGHSVVGGVIRAGLAGSSDPPFVGHLKGGWEQRGIQNQAQQAFHALLPGTQGPQAGAGSAEGPTCLPCFPQDCPPHPPLLPHPLGRGTRQFQGQWFVLGLASNTYRREDRALLNSFSTTYQLNKKGHFEVSNAMTRAWHVQRRRPGGGQRLHRLCPAAVRQTVGRPGHHQDQPAGNWNLPLGTLRRFACLVQAQGLTRDNIAFPAALDQLPEPAC